MDLGKNIYSNGHNVTMWPERQMGINFVSKSYLALARYIKCDIKLSRRSYC